MKYLFEYALTDEGWQRDLLVETDEHGAIVSKKADCRAKDAQIIKGYAVSGMANAHSHAFQYAMAGLAESIQAERPKDDFWSWREAMYRIALNIGPDQLEAVATMLYAEMLRHGYTSVAEFHYLHHDADGSRFQNLAEMSQRLIRAAAVAGISLCLVPVYYQYGDFGAVPSIPDQRRFVWRDTDEYFRLIELLEDLVAPEHGSRLGAGVHSLRAAAPEQVVGVLSMPGGHPLHIHIAEQEREVNACLAQLGKRPIEWLMGKLTLSHRHHLVHATHMNEEETAALAKSGAHVVLCPSTEGNLGDGFFPLLRYTQGGGKWSIGSDSHIGLSPWEELRWLDYQARLSERSRNLLCSEGTLESGDALYRAAFLGGEEAVGSGRRQYFELYHPLDAVVFDAEHPAFIGKPLSKVLSVACFAGDLTCLSYTIARGRVVVERGVHVNRDQIVAGYRRAIQ